MDKHTDKTRQEGLFGDLYSDLPQPEDKGILLRDILDEDVGEKYYLSDMKIEWLEKHSAKTGNAFHKFTGTDKACCITSTAEVKNNLSTNYVCVAMRGRNPDNPSNRTSGIHTEQRIEPNMDGKTNCLTSVQKDNLIIQRARGANKGGLFQDKCPTLTSNSFEHNNHVLKNYRTRRLTPTECARLQTVPEWYKWIVSETQQYKLLGNGWNIETVKHIFKFMK